MPVLPDAEQLTIDTGGQRIQGWLSVRVSRSVEMCPSNFECHITERFPGAFDEVVVIPGDICHVYLGGDLILSGWVNVYAPSYDGHTHTVSIAGRSFTQDIVDSSSPITPAQQSNLTGSLKKAIEFVLKDFPQVQLNFTASDVNIPNIIPITVGMTAYEIIEILCLYGQKLVFDDPQGKLLIADVGTTQAGSALVEGKNVEIGAARKDDSNRFHKIAIIGQTAVQKGSDGQHLNFLSDEPHGVDPDPKVRNERLKIIPWDQSMGTSNDAINRRADWERNRRTARGDQVQITVTGWRDGGGTLWTPNTLCSVQCPILKVPNANWIISECNWIRGDSGTQTILTLLDGRGLTPQPYVPPVSRGGPIPQPAA